jgi:NTE family protein
VLSPVILKNYSAQQSAPEAEWIKAIAEDPMASTRLKYVASQARSYGDGHRKYIHLLDGGLSDNLGLRGALDRAIAREQSAKLPGVPWKLPRRIALIVVDAHTESEYGWDSRERSLSKIKLLVSLGNVAISHYSFETLELFREVIARLARERTDATDSKPVEVTPYVIELHFNQLANQAERDFFNSVPTTLQLPAKTVDRLRDLAARELADNPEFKRLLRDLKDAPAQPSIVTVK